MPLFVEQSEEPPAPLESVSGSLEAAPGPEERSVFVSPDGRRARLLRALGRIAALITAAWLVALVAGALGFGRMPGLPLPAIGALAKPTGPPAPRAPAAGGVRKQAPSPVLRPIRPAGQSATRALPQRGRGSGASRSRGGASSGSRSSGAPSSGGKTSSGRGSGASATGSGKSATGSGKKSTGSSTSKSTGSSTSKGTRGAGGAHRSPRAPGPPPVKRGRSGTASGASRSTPPAAQGSGPGTPPAAHGGAHAGTRPPATL
jgi:hypothetical protein